ncbi:MAG: hypothetical protein GY758_29650, partial [Fuerstiella sp.]|nr:hypothetical protein [Fuerstiella sp.]
SVVIFPLAPPAPTVNEGCSDEIIVTPPATVPGFNIEYSFDDGLTWGGNTPPEADDCDGYFIRTRYVLEENCGSTLAGSISPDPDCAMSPAVLRVIDTQKPVITAPAPIEINCGNLSETAAPAALIADWLSDASVTDNCDTDPVMTHDFDGTALNLCADGTYTITVTWNAEDACGNDAVAQTSTITVVPDTEDPVITAPAGIEINCGNLSETADPAALIADWLSDASVTDNCDTDPVMTHDFDGTAL